VAATHSQDVRQIVEAFADGTTTVIDLCMPVWDTQPPAGIAVSG
jgi:hypothetical protein